MEVTNRFNRLNLINGVPEELWMEIHNIAHGKKALQIAQNRREAKGKEKRKDILIRMQSSKEEQREKRKPS